MSKSILIFLGIFAFSFSSFSQSTAEQAAKQLQECECNEILMIAGAIEKKYTGAWLESIEYKDGFIVFKKGANVHMWNPEKVIFIEKGAGFIRVYLEQSK